jgi:hypothetical protein
MLRGIFARMVPVAARRTLLAVSGIAAVSRLLAVARTPWDWDELLFMLSLRGFDVARHHPHPPGFPLFVAAGKLVRLLGLPDFRALQALNLLAGMAIVPAMYALCRALGMRESTSITAGALLAFAPNVWFYGGTGLSDVPSMVLVVIALALLFRDDDRGFALGAIVLGIAGGFRPQSLFIGAIPMLLAVVRKPRRIGWALVTAAIVTVSYVTAAWLTGWSAYTEVLLKHQRYIAAVDSFRNPARGPLWRLFDDFFIWPYRVPAINITLTALVVVSAVVSLPKLRPHVWKMLAAFGPFCLFAWLFLDRHSVSRFSIGYAPLLALMAADGLSIVMKRPRHEALAVTAVVLAITIWIWPALHEVQRTVSPPVQATDWIRTNAPPESTAVYADVDVGAYAEYYLTRYRVTLLPRGETPVAWSGRQSGIFIREDSSKGQTAGALQFTRPRGVLWDLVRRRYFEVSLLPVTGRFEYGSGWLGEEGTGAAAWRWMGNRSVTYLPPLRGEGVLTLHLYVPLDALPSPPTLTISLNGKVIERVTATRADIWREWTLPTRPGAKNELVIETDGVVNPAAKGLSGDTRTLGVRVSEIGWMRAPS